MSIDELSTEYKSLALEIASLPEWDWSEDEKKSFIRMRNRQEAILLQLLELNCDDELIEELDKYDE